MEIKDFNFLLSRGMLETLSAKPPPKTQVSHLNNFKNDLNLYSKIPNALQSFYEFIRL